MAAKKKKDPDDAPVSRFWKKVNLVADITSVIAGSPPSNEVFLEALGRIQDIIPFNSAVISFYDEDKGGLTEAVSVGEKVEPIDFIQFDLGAGFSAWAARQKKPLLLSDIKNPDRPPDKAIGSFLVIPLMVEKELVGVISFAHPQANFFREEDVKLLTILAGQIAVSWDRALYTSRLEERNQALIKAQKLLRKAQERLVNDERLTAVRELAVSINHEINNPLSVIIGNIQCLLVIEKDLNDEVIKRLNRVESEAMKIAEINRRLIKIDELVSETYISNGNKIKMINIEKSSAGEKNGYPDGNHTG